jgi:pimeloyl-ACP methyl ester carboxylesterase
VSYLNSAVQGGAFRNQHEFFFSKHTLSKMIRPSIFICMTVCCLFAAVMVSADQAQPQLINRDGVNLYVETTGNLAQNPVMIFIHGSAGNASSWDGVVGKYKHKYSTAAFTLRGTGASDKPYGPDSNSPYSFEMFSDDVHFVLQQLGVTEVICFGQNYGTNICNQLEFDHNDTISFAGAVLTGGNPLTVAATRTPSLTPSAAAWEFSEFNYGDLGGLCYVINTTIAAPGNALYTQVLQSIAGAVFPDRCDNLEELGMYYVVADSLGEDPRLTMWKLGCFGQNPQAWLYNEQFDILPVLANNWTPRQIIAGSENLAFSRQYTYYLASKLTPTIRRPGSTTDRPAGYSTPLLTTVVGNGNFVATTDVKTYTEIVDEFLKYVENRNVLKKCDVISVSK